MKSSLRAPLAVLLLAGLNSAVADSNPQTFDIPAQPLHSALQKLADQAGVAVSFTEQQVAGKSAPALKGSFSPREALQRLLVGSGLHYTFNGEGSVSIKNADAGSDAATAMPAVTVVGKAAYDANDPYNPDYRSRNSSTATKTDTPVMETPFSIQVVPKQVLEDRQSVRLDKALENVSGVIPAGGVGAAYGQQNGWVIRGFVTQDYYRDGMRVPGIRIADGFRELANIQKVEVLKGPASILYGRMEPGGIVNLVTKKPLDEAYTAVAQQFGSYDFYRTTVDSTGPITDDKSLLYRVNLAYENSGSYRDFVEHERVFLAPNLRWNISDRTTLDLHLEYQRSNNATDYGFLAPNNNNRPFALRNSLNLSGPNNKLDSERISFGFDWSHAFNDNWKINHRFDISYLPLSDLNPQFVPIGSRQFWEGGPACTSLSCEYYLIRYRQQQTAENYYSTLNLSGKFDTWGIHHHLLIGGDYTRINMRNTYAYSSDTPIMDVFNLNYSALVADMTNPNRISRNGQDEGWGGFYFQDQLELPYQVHILAGFRYDDATNTTWTEDLHFANPNRPLQPYTPVSNAETAAKPRFGIVWQPIKEVSVYGNYVENFGLSQGHNFNNQPLPALTAQQYEAGIKTEWFDGKLTGSLAWFEITKQNLPIPDTSDLGLLNGAMVAIGEVRSRGVEMDVAGEILPGWRVIGNYAYVDARVINDSDNSGGSGNVGHRLPNVPRNAASLWNTYELQDTALRGLKFGAGVVMRDQREGDLNNGIQLPGYATVDLMASYGFTVGKTKLTTQINAYNILDKGYYESTNGALSLVPIGYGIMPGAPTTVMGMVKVEF